MRWTIAWINGKALQQLLLRTYRHRGHGCHEYWNEVGNGSKSSSQCFPLEHRSECHLRRVSGPSHLAIEMAVRPDTPAVAGLQFPACALMHLRVKVIKEASAFS